MGDPAKYRLKKKELNKLKAESGQANIPPLPIFKHAGQPPKYTPEELVVEIAKYFEEWKLRGKPWTPRSLSLYVFGNSSSLWDYDKNPRYSGILKEARDWMNSEFDDSLVADDTKNVVGKIFYSKQHMGYSDKQEIVTTHDIGDSLADAIKLSRESKQVKPNTGADGELIDVTPPGVEGQGEA